MKIDVVVFFAIFVASQFTQISPMKFENTKTGEILYIENDIVYKEVSYTTKNGAILTVSTINK